MKQRIRTNGIKSTDKILLGALGVWLMLAAGSAYSLRAEFGGWAQGVKGDGKVIQEQRELADFDRMELNGSVVLHYQPDASTGCSVRADTNLLPYVETTVEDARLKIFVRGNIRPSHRIELHCQSPGLQSLTSKGAGHTNLAGINADQLFLQIQGTGDIIASGRASAVEASIQGTGAMELDALLIDQADLSIQGTGNIRAAQAAKVNVSITGTGNVHVTEDTQVDQINIRGTGQLKRR